MLGMTQSGPRWLWLAALGLLLNACGGAPLTPNDSRQPAMAVDFKLTATDTTTAIAWIERSESGSYFFKGKVFSGHRSDDLRRASTVTLTPSVAADFERIAARLELTLVRTDTGYLMTWNDGPTLKARFWNEDLTRQLSEAITLTPRAESTSRGVRSAYDPQRNRVAVLWLDGTDLRVAQLNDTSHSLVRTGDRIARDVLRFDMAANLGRDGSAPPFLVSYITGPNLRDRQVRSFPLDGPVLGQLNAGPESTISESASPTEYELLSVAYHHAAGGYVTAFTEGEQIHAVTQGLSGIPEIRQGLGERRIYFRRTGSTESILHHEDWYGLDLVINPNGVAVLFLQHLPQTPLSIHGEVNLYGRPVGGLGTTSPVSIGPEVLLAAEEPTTGAIPFQRNINGGWNGAFEFVWDQDMHDYDSFSSDFTALYSAVNANVQFVD